MDQEPKIIWSLGKLLYYYNNELFLIFTSQIRQTEKVRFKSMFQG